MGRISRKEFLTRVGAIGTSIALFGQKGFAINSPHETMDNGVTILPIEDGEDVFSYIIRIKGRHDITLYRQVIGAANAFKEGDLSLGVAAADDQSRMRARLLLSNTKLADLIRNVIFEDDLYALIGKTTNYIGNEELYAWTMGELKEYVLGEPEKAVKKIMPSLTSDIIGCLVKLWNNEELIQVGRKIFNPLANSQIGSKGYLGARIQPNSPTDHEEDIVWQVFDAWSYAVGDLVLGTNPVSSEPESVAGIEKALLNILTTFELENVMPNCVLAHIDIQAEVEKLYPGTTGIWFQSLAGTVEANNTFDITIDKMLHHVSSRKGRYGLYAETGQGADFTNGHGEGFDMVLHEARKYGFLRALKGSMSQSKSPENIPWVHVNDVAGFIGPEVFKTKEQLVRCCLEDTVMGKLHGLTIGLDICSTLHMDVSLEDLDWCIEQVMPANPAYLMALPTKNDPMLSYLTTSFSDHVRVREQFGYKVNDAMWEFFKTLEVIDKEGRPTPHFGDPLWVYYKYCQARSDTRSKDAIFEEGRNTIARIRDRGVPIAEGYGQNIWDLEPALQQQVTSLYEDAKVSLWTVMTEDFVKSIPNPVPIITSSRDRKDYVYHPESGEALSAEAIRSLENLRLAWKEDIPDIQIIISDGLNPRALMDEGHLMPFLGQLRATLTNKGYTVGQDNIVIRHGRVRAGYACGEVLYGGHRNPSQSKGIVHIIGERPGSGHHNFSAYLTAAPVKTWTQTKMVDHNISKVVSGISDTSLSPERATVQTTVILDRLFTTI
ncbi:MAG TPA: ethanolamine ammonia-lyase subunit EutB [Eudoraea sp.]|nr:ethanolamine ammonia-lyase subunit EutB [Eudoraea sp.]